MATGGGISIPQLPATAIAGAGELVVYAYSRAKAGQALQQQQATLQIADAASGAYRPPQWSVGIPAMTMLTVGAEYSGIVTYSDPQGRSTPGENLGTKDANGNTIFRTVTAETATGVPQYFVFDGVARVRHSQPMTPTEYPVQDNANISDHIRRNQARVTIEVIMTDVLPAYAAGQWVGNASKSISCFQTLCSLRDARVPLTVTTRLKTYTNMFIIDVIPDETVKTLHGFRGLLELRQIFTASVSTQNISARAQTTDATPLGQTSPTPVPAGVVSQNKMPQVAAPPNLLTQSQAQQLIGQIKGAGQWSSNPCDHLQRLVH